MMRRSQRHLEAVKLVTGFQLSFMLVHHQIEKLPDLKVQNPWETAVKFQQNGFGSHLPWYAIRDTAYRLMANWPSGYKLKDTLDEMLP